MSALKTVGRVVGVALGAVLLLAGGFGLMVAYAPGTAFLHNVYGVLQGMVGVLGLPVDAVVSAEEVLSSMALRFVVAPIGLGTVIGSLLAGRGGSLPKPRGKGKAKGNGRGKSKARGEEIESILAPPEPPSKLEKKFAKKARKAAGTLAKRGRLHEAAESLFDIGDLEGAAEYFIEAKQFVRAAEIRHDQNRFLESAELYLEAEKFDSAGAIFGQQEEWQRAAECYLKTGKTSVAAEMFEKAEDYSQAAECYRQAGFLRHAAQAYVRCKSWRDAAECLREVYTDEGGKGHTDPKKAAELTKLVRQAGQLYRRAGDDDAAQEILEKGGCVREAAELALEREQFAKAADLFTDAGDARRAAEALRSLGEDEEAARVLGMYHRDQGEAKEAAAYFEEAKDFLSAGDLYRQLEDYTKAGTCYQQQTEYSQAAEMFKAAGDHSAAGECYERGKDFAEAAECFEQVGMPERQAELLAKAGQFLKSGQCYHREGMDDEAIKVLQQVPSEDADFAAASALLGDIFQAHGQLGLAIKKLRQAIGDADLTKQNLDVYYTLARVYSSNQEPHAGVEIFEKIMTFDYHYKDVEQRLLEAREAAAAMPPPTETPLTSGIAGASTNSPVQGQPGRYQVVGELGRGGMGIVYKAKDTILDREVAYKVLPDSLNGNETAIQNFLREAKSAAKLNHPNIVTVYDCGEQDGRYYIAMEYVDGTTLKEIVRRRGMISPAGIFHVVLQICDALGYAHEKKVVHRDIKTANAMWTREKKAKIMDFGLAKVMQEVRNHTTVVAGTPYYMSPEQTLGKNVDHRTDIYSLGVTIFEMATGTVPFKEGNIPYHHVHTPPPDIRELQQDLPKPLAAIVARCLMKDPSQRYQSVAEISAELRALLGSSLS